MCVGIVREIQCYVTFLLTLKLGSQLYLSLEQISIPHLLSWNISNYNILGEGVLFHFIVLCAELRLHLKVMPQVQSHCVCCTVKLRSLLRQSQRKRCIRGQTRAPCNVVFIQPPYQVSTHHIRGPEGPKEATHSPAAPNLFMVCIKGARES